MKPFTVSVLWLSRKASAFAPVMMSVIALALVLASVAAGYVTTRESDEGAVAHLWQLLMAGQLPLIAHFSLKWFPRVPRQTVCVVALQIGAALIAMAPVYLLGL